ncbi:glycosyltransferase family 2 protein [Actinophytocola gossypii]|uniref:Glycosyltransferase family 2 protein n=1 Tax=Actinophytocola gossypii TaxID=2812003 RepID=A0ABT2JFN1_9PSEU|nr:glycosyltransferase family 2 protein [Actinophytocola gossypii]MCT2586685.1 glycosyltransferase family 2 protein [Actinophytocola gossypii]
MENKHDSCELSIVMPCLNEAETLATCIEKAQGYLDRSGVVGEVVIADNGSTDGSQEIARKLGARVVNVTAKGYGSALMGGIRAARGTYVIMGDADDSYDFANLDPFVAELRKGAELVMGNRFKGGIEPDAMPPLHKYLGNPVLSAVGKLFFKAPVGDFHCGLRGFRREAIMRIGLHTTGMEFASEVVVKSCMSGLRISEVPTTLKKDGRSRPPHLRSWRDGWRHLRFLLIYSPRWLFLYPGLAAFGLGLLASLALLIGPITVGSVGFDIGTMIYAAGFAILGYQAVLFSVMTKLFGAREGLLPMSQRYRHFVQRLTVERGLILGIVIFLAGVLVTVAQVIRWGGADFGAMDGGQTVRTAIPAVLGLVLGFQTIMFSMFTGVLGIPTAEQPKAEEPVRAKADELVK